MNTPRDFMIEMAAATILCIGATVIAIAYGNFGILAIAIAIATVLVVGGLAYVVLSRQSDPEISRPRLALTIAAGILVLAAGVLAIWLVYCSC